MSTFGHTVNPKQLRRILDHVFSRNNALQGKGQRGTPVLIWGSHGQKLCEELRSGKEVYARRFADSHGYDMEYVHEIFALLHPWVKSARKSFEEDTIDELYGYPVNITETTPIYLALGRRDIKLEYQHKVLSLK